MDIKQLEQPFRSYFKSTTFPVSTKGSRQLSTFVSHVNAKVKVNPPQKHTLISVQEGSPFQKLSIDFVGPFWESRRGNTYLLTVKDCFTRWLEAFPTKKIDAQEVVRLLETEIFARFGHPRQIHSDQGAQFHLEHDERDLQVV